MAARDPTGMIPIVGGLVVGAGIVALIYKLGIMNDDPSMSMPVPVPISAVAPERPTKEADKPGEPREPREPKEVKDTSPFPCRQDGSQGPCSNPYSRRRPYCQ